MYYHLDPPYRNVISHILHNGCIRHFPSIVHWLPNTFWHLCGNSADDETIVDEMFFTVVHTAGSYFLHKEWITRCYSTCIIIYTCRKKGYNHVFVELYLPDFTVYCYWFFAVKNILLMCALFVHWSDVLNGKAFLFTLEQLFLHFNHSPNWTVHSG